MKPKDFYDQLIANMPAGIERAMLRCLSFHIGKDNAISKPDLLRALKQSGFAVHERQARLTIEELRNNGHLIGASSGEGGYYIIADMGEWEAYQREERSRAEKILVRLRAQEQQAKTYFRGVPREVEQVSLF